LSKKERTTAPETEMQVLRPGERSNYEGKPVANNLLLSIPDEEFNGVRPDLEYVELP